jgi:hypothetical protein
MRERERGLWGRKRALWAKEKNHLHAIVNRLVKYGGKL